MDNAYGKGQNVSNASESANAVPIKIPKNIRQVGSIGNRNKVIYVEDYVMTFIKQLSDKEPAGCRVAILLGYYVNGEEHKKLFIKGAIEMKDADLGNGIALTDEGWTSIYEAIKKYFTDVEIIGWALIGPEFFLESSEKVRKIHTDNFSGPDKTLLKMDSMEKEEGFYFHEGSQMVKQNGYYIYYEKNEEMQNYMIENKSEDMRIEETYTDQATRKIRTIIQDKKEVKDDRNVVRLLYAASSLLAIIVLVIAATMLDNYDKMRSMETALNTISQSLNNTGKEDGQQVADGSGDKKSNEDKDGNQEKDTTGNKDTTGEKDAAEGKEDEVEVETVNGNITSTPKEGDNAKTDNQKDSEPGNKQETADNEKNEPDAEKVPTQAAQKEENKDKEEPSQEASATVKYYTVKSGDSLAGISFKLYNTYSYMEKIKKLNGIEDENKILAGQKLIVP
jgi:LysM repeat protein